MGRLRMAAGLNLLAVRERRKAKPFPPSSTTSRSPFVADRQQLGSSAFKIANPLEGVEPATPYLRSVAQVNAIEKHILSLI